MNKLKQQKSISTMAAFPALESGVKRPRGRPRKTPHLEEMKKATHE